MARAARHFALTTILVLALGMVAAGAEEVPTTHVETLTTTVGATTLGVAGKAVFVGGPATTVGTDAANDGRMPGSDLISASITQVNHTTLRFELGVRDLPPVVGGTPEVLNYNWPLEVTKGTSSSQVSLQAWRSATAADLTCGVVFVCPAGSPEGKPRFTVNTCSIDATTGQNTCTPVGVTGEFTATGLAWNVPVTAMNAGGGAVLNPTDPIAASHGVSGVSWNTAGTTGDTMTFEPFTVFGPTVMLGTAPAGTPDADVVLTTPAKIANNGNFTATLPKPAAGDHVVVAKACLGDASCGSLSRVVTVP